MKLKAYLEKLREKGWTIKVVPKSKKEMSVIHFTALDLLRFGFIATILSLVFLVYILTGRTQERVAFRNLQSEIQTQQDHLHTLQQQKAVVESLLNEEAGKLENHLKALKQQEEKIRKLLGVKQRTGKKIRALGKHDVNPRIVAYRRFDNKSSRGGSYSELMFRLASLQREIGQEEFHLGQIKVEALQRHEEIIEERKKLLAIFDCIPSLWPVSGAVTSGFGYRSNPFEGGGEFHPGIDIAAPYASPIHASASGVCIFSGWDGGFGYTVRINHGNGIITQYSHCSRLLVHEGEQVKKGEEIALVGSTGYSTGTHLHFQVFYDGRIVNPLHYLGLTFNQMADREIPRLISKGN